MVFIEVDSITDVAKGNRIIIYYIRGKTTNFKETNLCNALESALVKLGKKNDDLLIVQILKDSIHFLQFQEIYQAEVTGVVTLFAINNTGIPIICEQIYQEENVSLVIEYVCKNCKLNQIQETEILTVNQLERISNLNEDSLRMRQSSIHCVEGQTGGVITAQEKLEVEEKASSTTRQISDISGNRFNEDQSNNSTELRIQLPDGSKHYQKFKKDSELQEVWIFISTKFKFTDFDLKTYNRQAFSEDDYVQTLQDLDLFPNGVIIVVPKNVSLNRNGGIVSMIQFGLRLVVNKTTSVFRYIHGLLFIFWNSFFNNGGSGSQPRRQIRSPQQDGSEPSSSQQRGFKKSSKKFGNVHTLSRNDDSDDENNRYNGNSTQQK